jgi:aquaporin TIP
VKLQVELNMDRDWLERSIAEFVGIFALVFVGAGSVVIEAATGAGLVSIALAHGFVIAVMASAVGHISGAHFNPAVTLGFLVTGRIAVPLAVIYWIAQFSGAVAGALALKLLVPANLTEPVSLGAPVLGGGISPGAAMVVEAILTFFLVWVIFATAADPRGTFTVIAGLAIGFTIVFGVLFAGPLTSAMMNPGRAFGPELMSGEWANAWVWYVGPALGGAAAALTYEWVYLRRGPTAPLGSPESGLDEPRPADVAR